MSVNCRHRDTHHHPARGTLQLAVSVSVLTAVASWVVGCGEPQAPVAESSIEDLTVEVGSTESVDLAAYFSDPDGDELTYTARSSNTSIATVSVSGTKAQVTAVAAGSATVTATATDPDELSADQTFMVTVPNRGPEAGEPIEDIEVFVGEDAQVDVSGNFSDPDGDALSYTATTSDPGVATAAVSGSTVTVSGVSRGTADVTVTATDPGGLLATQAFMVTVPNRAPQAGEPIEDIEVFVGEDAQVDVSGNFSDPDGDALSYTATTSEPGVATASVSGSAVTVTGVSPGRADVTVTATDPGGLSAMQAFTTIVRSPDRPVLEILYDELDGDNWTDNTNWLTDAPIDEWYGVSTGAGGRVDTLDLSYNSLMGEIPPELGDLSNLEMLSFEGDSLTGEIPPELGDLSNLERLDLSDNELTGEIPSELADLSNLIYLALGSNDLTGEIPSELANLPSLQRLYLDSNSLTGEIPSELADLSNLEVLYLDGNQITGEIPSELGSLSSLEELFLGGNSLTGEIPPELGDLSNLEIMWLGFSSLTGDIPPELGDLSSLEWLDLTNNSLTGEIPRDFLDLSALLFFFWESNDGLCAPDTSEFDDWLDELLVWSGPRCD